MSVSLEKFALHGICGCEHIQHEGATSGRVGSLHASYKVPASSPWAAYVGHVCEWCAEHCVSEYIRNDHDCTESGCSSEFYWTPEVNERSQMSDSDRDDLMMGVHVEMRGHKAKGTLTRDVQKILIEWVGPLVRICEHGYPAADCGDLRPSGESIGKHAVSDKSESA